MGSVKPKNRILSEQEIDGLVIAQADDESAWEKPVIVNRSPCTPVFLPSDLAERAGYFARLHHEANLSRWLQKVIQERLDMEEAVLAGCKKGIKNG